MTEDYSNIEPLSPSQLRIFNATVAVMNVHADLGLDESFPLEPGAKLILLAERLHQSGILDSDGVRRGLVQSLEELPQPHRKALGFGMLNHYPSRAIEYVGALLVEGARQDALPISIEEASQIASGFD